MNICVVEVFDHFDEWQQFDEEFTSRNSTYRVQNRSMKERPSIEQSNSLFFYINFDFRFSSFYSTIMNIYEWRQRRRKKLVLNAAASRCYPKLVYIFIHFACKYEDEWMQFVFPTSLKATNRGTKKHIRRPLFSSVWNFAFCLLLNVQKVQRHKTLWIQIKTIRRQLKKSSISGRPRLPCYHELCSVALFPWGMNTFLLLPMYLSRRVWIIE